MTTLLIYGLVTKNGATDGQEIQLYYTHYVTYISVIFYEGVLIQQFIKIPYVMHFTASQTVTQNLQHLHEYNIKQE